MASFAGFPEEAASFYERLGVDNTRAFWQANKVTYDEAVRAPMVSLLEELAAEFGSGSVFRPQRDIRFSKDKSPYKTYQGGFVPITPGTGYYVELSAAGLQVGGGFHAHSPTQVDRYRRAVDDDSAGQSLETLVD